MRKQSRGKFGIQHADLLISLARDTIGIKEGVAGVAMDIHHILMQLEAADGFVAEIESEMEDNAHADSLQYQDPLDERSRDRHRGRAYRRGRRLHEVQDPVGDHEARRPRPLRDKLREKKRTEEDIETGKEPASEDPLLCGYLDHTKERDHVQLLYTSLIGRGMKRTSALIVIAKKLLRIIHAIVRDDRDYVRDYGSPKRMVIKKAA